MKRFLSLSSAALALVACASLQLGEAYTIADDIERVQVRWSDGTVELVLDEDASQIAVQRQTWGPEAALAYRQDIHDGSLLLEMRCLTPAPCGGHLRLSLPPGVAVDADLAAGELSLIGLGGGVVAMVGRGNIAAAALGAGDAVLQVAHGNIQADWLQAPERVVASSAEGDVHLLLPAGGYDIKDMMGGGTLSGVHQDMAAPRSIRFTALGGEAKIEGYEATVARDPQV